ncbi:hypothetical protein [Nonomuraea basaltis]|uniref:hypothetical protein n=1 Tax=Nonomuraea basaltis TaxID=2495887 RepID=UPI00197DE245|nr:hypothetical protein [Nonomuraea basaltis]
MAILELPDIAPATTHERHGETDDAEVHPLLRDPELCMAHLDPNLTIGTLTAIAIGSDSDGVSAILVLRLPARNHEGAAS